MRLAAVTRLFNEDDILEAFIRHHAAFVDTHILLDNGSTDRSLDILSALKGEGFDIAVYRNASSVFVEPIFNTALLAAALRQAPDWVLFLDCDEFIDDRGAPGGLSASLARVPAEIPSVRVALVDYLASTPGSAGEANCVERLVLRRPGPNAARKVFVRRPSDTAGWAISAGSHFLLKEGRVAEPRPDLDEVRLAHFPERSVPQSAAKTIIGRLKVLATGREGETLRWNEHYTSPFEELCQDPADWLARAEARMSSRQEAGDLVHDPMPYRGGKLTHLASRNPVRHATTAVLRHVERLAAAHGRLMDAVPAAAQHVVTEASSFSRVL